MSNLFICATPLQLKIVYKIVEDKKFNNKKNDIIYYSFDKKKKIIHKNNKINKVIQLRLHQRFPFYIFFLKKKLTNFKYENIFIATYIGRIGQVILNIISFNKLKFFSDGSLNIFDNKMQEKMIELGENNFKKFFSMFFDIFFNFKKISYFKKIVNEEYTIYPKKNLENYKFIYLRNLWDKKNKSISQIKINPSKKVLRIFIGIIFQELFENMKINNENREKIIKKLNEFLIKKKIDIYISHPREKKIKLRKNKFTKVLKLQNTVEDFIINEKFYNKKIEVYGFCGSTTLFNLSNIKGIKTYMLVFFLKNYYENIYSKQLKNFKIKLLKLYR